MFWNIAHMKGASCHTHTHISSCHCPLCLMQLGPRVACHVVKYLKFMCYIRHLFSSFFLPLFGISIVVRGCRGRVGRGAWVCQSKYSRKMLGIAGEIPLCSVRAQLAIDFYCKSVRVLCFFAIVVFRESLFTLKRIACVCVCVFIA